MEFDLLKWIYDCDFKFLFTEWRDYDVEAIEFELMGAFGWLHVYSFTKLI